MKKRHSSFIVMSEDLNHHRTLFVGKATMWLMETGFMTTAMYKKPEEVVCFAVNMSKFLKPVPSGAIIDYTGQVAHVGKSSVTVYIYGKTFDSDDICIEGLVTYITIDKTTRKKVANGIVMDEPADEEEVKMRQRALKFLSNSNA